MKFRPFRAASSPKKRTRPYRTQDSTIDGALALQDMDAVESSNERLTKSLAFFRGIVNTVREPLLVLDDELRVVAANESFLITFEVSSEQTIKRRLYELGNGQWNIPALRKLLERVLPEKETVTDFEVDHVFENIGYRKMILNARRLAQPDQSQPMILLAIEDITERGQIIETLRASEERFRTLFSLGPVAVYYCDASGAIQNFNRRAAELWGRTPKVGVTDEEFCGSHKLFRPDGTFMPHDQCPMAEVLNGTIEDAVDQEVLIERPDGSRVVVIVNIRSLRNSRGEITGAINCFYDITERKQVEASLRESEERFRMIADNISQLAWTCDDLGNVTWYNQRWLDYTGMTLKEMEGWDWSKVQHPDHLNRVVQGVKHARDTSEIWEDIFPLRSKDGTYRWFLSRAVPIRDADGKLVRWFGTNTDITERRLTEEALIKSEKLAAAGRMAATLAHEINNPLQAVANLVSIWAQSPGLDAQSQAYAAMAESELRRITHLTQQSLKFYRESASPTLVDIEETIDSVLSIYDKRIRAKGIHITRRYRSDDAAIRTYPGEIRQVFSTLLLNAMEAVDTGGTIAVRVRKASHWQNPEIQGVRATIVDDGVGIPRSNIPRIFEPFFTTKGENGTGLGLWVASGIVNRCGGSILTRSSMDPGRHGTCFSIFLPAES